MGKFDLPVAATLSYFSGQNLFESPSGFFKKLKMKMKNTKKIAKNAPHDLSGRTVGLTF